MANESQNYKILLADDDSEARDFIDFALKNAGFTTISLDSGEKVIETVHKEAVDLVLLDVDMPFYNGFQLVQMLRSDLLARHIPIILLTATRVDVCDKVEGLGLGSDDYILKPFDVNEFLARVKAVLGRTYRSLNANPLTRLPGNVEILREIDKRIRKQMEYVFLYLDINSFKAFNDRYGFVHGDKAISLLSKVIFEAIKSEDDGEDFIGHVGGDDFFVVTQPARYERICNKILTSFSDRVRHLYDEEDRRNGFIIVHSRMGGETQVPIMSLTVVGISNCRKKIEHSGEVSALVGELKNYAKKLGGNQFVMDRRN